MTENSETPKEKDDEKIEHNHEHDYTYISSSNGEYKICRGCNDIILIF